MNTPAHSLALQHAPQVFVDITTAGLYRATIVLLLAPVSFGIFIFGFQALLTVGAAVATALATELLISRRRSMTGHGLLIGLIVGASMPPGVSVLIPVSATLFALLVAKWSFGGIESYWVNPAAAGLVYAYFSFPRAMQQGWLLPDLDFFGDAISTATPLTVIRSKGILAWLEAPETSFLDERITDMLNTTLLNPLGVNIPKGLVDPFLGFTSGAVGETSVLLILIVSVFLITRCLLPVRVIVGYFFGFAVPWFVFGGIPSGLGFFQGNVLVQILHGGFFLGMFFLATEMVSTPLAKPGHLVYGILVGALIMLFSLWQGSTALGVASAVLLANMLVPLIDTCTAALQKRKRYTLR